MFKHLLWADDYVYFLNESLKMLSQNFQGTESNHIVQRQHRAKTPSKSKQLFSTIDIQLLLILAAKLSFTCTLILYRFDRHCAFIGHYVSRVN